MYRFIMRTLGVIVMALIGFGIVLLFGPRQNVNEQAFTDQLADIPAEQAQDLFQESPQLTDIKDGQNRQIIWASKTNQKTDISILYMHGFSASLQEIRPVPDMVAAELGANIVYTRLSGHGRTGIAMADVNINDWMSDFALALSVARAVGEKVVILSTSTGGTLTAAGVNNSQAMQDVVGMVFVSPNFAVVNPAANLAKLPFFSKWGPLLAGQTRSFEPRNEGQETYWTTSYPTRSVVPMMRLIDYVEDVDFSAAKIPALFYFSDSDKVVDASVTRDVISRWGVQTSVINPTLTKEDDPFEHVVLGSILSPNQNEIGTAAMVEWINGL